MPNVGHLSLLGGQVAQEQGRVDLHGPPQQPGEEAAGVANPKPGAAVASLSQLPPPAPGASPIVRDRPAHLHPSCTSWIGLNLAGKRKG